jgi:hypothetical protein
MYYNSSGGACVFFDIDVKGGESVVNFTDATVVYLHVFQGVSINAKGGDCWHVFIKRVEYVYLSLMAKIIVIRWRRST